MRATPEQLKLIREASELEYADDQSLGTRIIVGDLKVAVAHIDWQEKEIERLDGELERLKSKIKKFCEEYPNSAMLGGLNDDI